MYIIHDYNREKSLKEGYIVNMYTSQLDITHECTAQLGMPC